MRILIQILACAPCLTGAFFLTSEFATSAIDAIRSGTSFKVHDNIAGLAAVFGSLSLVISIFTPTVVGINKITQISLFLGLVVGVGVSLYLWLGYGLFTIGGALLLGPPTIVIIWNAKRLFLSNKKLA